MATNIEMQCQRIAANVSRALAAIAEKGGTIPDGANSNNLEELIAGIESAQVASGEIATPNASWQVLNGTTFACPFVPKVFVLLDSKNTAPANYWLAGVYKDSKWNILYATNGTLGVKSGAPNSTSYPSFSLSGDALKMSCSSSNSYTYLRLSQNRDFYWCAIG